MDSYFQEGVKLKGVLRTRGIVHVDGVVEGEVFSADHMIVGKKGLIDGDVESYDITNMGTIKGNVLAKNKVSLMDNSHLIGDITTHQLVVEEGSNFEGQCKMEGKPQVVKKIEPPVEPGNGHDPDFSLDPLQETIEEITQSSKVPAPADSSPATSSILPKVNIKVVSGVLGVLALAVVALNYPFKDENDISFLLSKGQNLIEEKQFSEAEGIFQQALQKTRSHPEVYAGLGDVYLHKKEFSKAKVQFQRSVELAPREPTYQLRLARSLTGSRQFDDASKIYKDVLEQDPNNFEAYFDMGNLKIQQGQKEEGLAAVAQSVRLKKDFYEGYQLLAVHYSAEGNMSQAIEAQRAMVELNDEEPELHLVLGNMLVKAGRDEEAVSEYKQVIKMFPKNLKAQMLVADWYFKKGNMDKALSGYQMAEELEPENPVILTRLGQIYLKKNDKQNAELAYRKATQVDPKDSESVYQFGLLMVESNKLGEAQAAFEKAVSLDENLAPAHYQLGTIYYNDKKFDLAVQSYRKAHMADKENIPYMVSLGRAWIERKNPDKAVVVLLKAAKLAPENGNVSFTLCRAYRKKGYYTIAIGHCEKALAALPDFDPLKNRLAWLYAKKRTKLDVALKMAQGVVNKYPDKPEYIDTLAEVFYASGKKDEAITTMKKALEISPDSRYFKQQMWKFKHIKPKPPEVAKAPKPAKVEKPAVEKPASQSGATDQSAEKTEESSAVSEKGASTVTDSDIAEPTR